MTDYRGPTAARVDAPTLAKRKTNNIYCTEKIPHIHESAEEFSYIGIDRLRKSTSNSTMRGIPRAV